MRLFVLLYAISLSAAVPARAVEEGDSPMVATDEVRPPKDLPLLTKSKHKEPWPVLMLVQQLHRGMFIRLPVVDTNPNRGVTAGIMPIWVFQGESDTRIRHIHAPSFTYNKNFGFRPTYRYYHYPTRHSSYQFRASISKDRDREVMFQMEDWDFLDRGIAATTRFQYDFDGSYRFFGIGPDTPESWESNFTRKLLSFSCRVGLPLFPDSPFRFNFAHSLTGQALEPGNIEYIPDIGERFPGHTPVHWHQDAEFQLFIDYDSRDEAVTTTNGAYAMILIGNSQRGWGSEYPYQRYRADLRWFWKPGPKARHATAVRYLYEQLKGDAPFWLMPSLGGKMLHRAYGAGRYIDQGMWTATVEERLTVYSVKVSGVITEMEVAPFAGAGTVFGSAGRMAAKYVRPVFGAAFRAIARPQVVGSVDIGVGQEGAAVFMSINYSY